MKRWAGRLRKILVTLILTGGVMALLLRGLTPLLEYARQPVADWLGRQIDTPVSIGKLQAGWYGFGPRIRFSQVTLGRPNQAVHFRQADLDLAFGGLFSGHLANLLRLTISGLHLNLVRQRDGYIDIQGLPPIGSSTPTGQVTLPSRLRLHDLSLDWLDQRIGGKSVHLSGINVRLESDGDTLKARARLQSALGNLRFAADLHGDLNSERWSGRSYLELQNIDLQPLFGAYLPAEYRMRGGRLSGRVWQQWQQARAVHAQGNLTLTGLTFGSAAHPSHQVALQRLGGHFEFQRKGASDWALHIGSLTLQAAGQPTWPSGALAVRRTHAADGQATIDAAATRLRLGVLAKLLAVRPPDPAWQPALSALAPDGLLQDLRFRIDPAHPSSWALSGRFSELGWQAWNKIPGLANLSGRFAAAPGAGNVQLDARNLDMSAGRLFRNRLAIQQLHGALYWRYDDAGWSLQSSVLDLNSADLGSRLRFRLSRSGDAPTQLQLLARLHDADVATTSRYLPAGIMGRDIVKWLDMSLSTGTIEHATALVDGPLQDFPFDHRRSGAFQVVAYTQDTALHYQHGWPPLAHVDARLDFHENSLDIDLLKGSIYNSTIEQAHASIASLNPTSPLRMQGSVSGPLADPIRLLGEPALRDDFGHIARELKVGGNSRLKLQFQVPLVHGRGKYQLDGNLHFLDDSMQLPRWKLALSHIDGDLKIGLHALHANNIRARGLGAPLRVAVTPLKDGSTRVSATGTLSRGAIAKQLPTLPLQPVSGKARFSIAVLVPGLSAPANSPTRVRVSSDLRGMRIDLPDPLGKTAPQRRQLDVTLGLGAGRTPVRVDYGKLDALFSADGRRGEVRYASGAAQLPATRGFRIKARFDQLDLAAWDKLAERFGGATSGLNDWQAEIQAKALRYGTLSLGAVDLTLHGDPHRIQGKISGSQLAGDFSYPLSGTDPLEATLSKLHLTFATHALAAESKPGELTARSTPLDPRHLPPLRLAVDELQLNAAKLGKLQLDSHPTAEGLELDSLDIHGPSGSLLASGSWTHRGRATETLFRGSFSTPGLGTLLQALGISRNIDEAPGQGTFDLQWSGDPYQISFAGLAGKAGIDLKQGRLTQVEPGITRAIGLLSLDALKRRLKLDFGDLLKKGYSFDSIKGQFRFEHGQAFTNDLRIDGPSSRIESAGSIGLVDRTFNQVVLVIPNLGATLPLVSTLAGGPVAGVATLVAQQLFSQQMDQIYRFVYSLTGTWEDPKITVLKGGGPLSTLVNQVTGEKSQAQTPEQRRLLREDPQQPDLLKRILNTLPPLPFPGEPTTVTPKTRPR